MDLNAVPMIYKTWFEADRAVEKIADWARPFVEAGEIAQIYAIPKGGLALGLMLSHQLGEIPIVDREDHISDDTLILDEIIHRGATMMQLLVRVAERKRKPKTAAWILRNSSLYVPDYYAEKMYTADIVKHPWETEKSAWESYMRSQAG